MRHFVDDDPLDPRIYIPNIEIYITNVCNLTCTNCNRFNNYDFKGWQRWSDYADQYAEWATKIRLRQITLLGGEPLLNPTVVDWVEGINKLWKKRVQILTNGTRINHVPGLYELLLREPDPTDPWKKNWIGISLHNPNDRDRCFDEIRQFLKGDIKYYHKDDPKNHDNYLTYGGTHAFIDSPSKAPPSHATPAAASAAAARARPLPRAYVSAPPHARESSAAPPPLRARSGPGRAPPDSPRSLPLPAPVSSLRPVPR